MVDSTIVDIQLKIATEMPFIIIEKGIVIVNPFKGWSYEKLLEEKPSFIIDNWKNIVSTYCFFDLLDRVDIKIDSIEDILDDSNKNIDFESLNTALEKKELPVIDINKVLLLINFALWEVDDGANKEKKRSNNS